MHSKLGSFAHSLLSGLNDGAATFNVFYFFINLIFFFFFSLFAYLLLYYFIADLYLASDPDMNRPKGFKKVNHDCGYV